MRNDGTNLRFGLRLRLRSSLDLWSGFPFGEYENSGGLVWFGLNKAASSSEIRRFLEKRDIYISLYPQGCCSTDTGETEIGNEWRF